MILVWAVFVISVFMIVHTYLFYPALLQFLTRFESKTQQFSTQSYRVAMLIAAYNEEQIIQEKLLSVLNNVPNNVDLDVFVGSDASTDSTNEIIQ